MLCTRTARRLGENSFWVRALSVANQGRRVALLGSLRTEGRPRGGVRTRGYTTESTLPAPRVPARPCPPRGLWFGALPAQEDRGLAVGSRGPGVLRGGETARRVQRPAERAVALGSGEQKALLGPAGPRPAGPGMLPRRGPRSRVRRAARCYSTPSMKLVSRCWMSTRRKDISLRVFSKMTRGSSDWQRRQLGAITMARLLTSILVMATLAGCTNT